MELAVGGGGVGGGPCKGPELGVPALERPLWIGVSEEQQGEPEGHCEVLAGGFRVLGKPS